MRFISDWLISVYPTTLFYNIGVSPDLWNTSRNILNIQPSNLFFGSEKYYLEDHFGHYVDALRNYLRKVLELLAEDDAGQKVFKNSTEEVERRVEAFIEVEKRMATVRFVRELNYH